MPILKDRVNPWGVKPEDEKMVTAHEALATAGLEWTVSARDLVMEDGSITPFRAIVNDTTGAIYAAVRDRAVTFQNYEVADFCETVADLFGEKMVVGCGSLDKGAKMYMVLRLDHMECDFRFLTGQEAITGYMLVRNTHDGSGALTAEPVFVRPFCTNQFPAIRLARKDGKGFVSIRHTTNMQDRIADAAASLGLVTRHAREMDEIGARLANSVADLELVEKVVTKLIPVPKERGKDKALDLQDDLRRNIFGSDTLGDFKGTRWGLLNGVTEFFQHENEPRFAGKTPVSERRMLNNTTGVAARARATVWDLLV